MSTSFGSSSSHVEGGGGVAGAGAAALRGLPRRARLDPRRLGRDTRCFSGGGSYGDFDQPDFSKAYFDIKYLEFAEVYWTRGICQTYWTRIRLQCQDLAEAC